MSVNHEGRSVTIGDIAEAMGVTKAAVSYALNGKGRISEAKRAAILERAREMGFVPNPHAQRLTHGRCLDTVSLLVRSLDLTVGTRKVHLLQRALKNRGYKCPVYVSGHLVKPGDGSMEEAARDVRLQKPLGLLYNASFVDEGTYPQLRAFQEEGGVLVTYDYPLDLECDQVVFDREDNSRLATLHLLEMGHRKIAFLGGWPTPLPERLRGHLSALEQYGIAARNEWILPSAEFASNLDLDGMEADELGTALVEPFLALKDRPTAISIADDIMAAAFIAESLRRGLSVPGDISVIGQDNLSVGRTICPVPLSTVSQPLEEIAEATMELLLDRVEGRWTGGFQTRVIKGALISRESVARV